MVDGESTLGDQFDFRNCLWPYRSRNDLPKHPNRASPFLATGNYKKRVSSLENNEVNAENLEGNAQQSPAA